MQRATVTLAMIAQLVLPIRFVRAQTIPTQTIPTVSLSRASHTYAVPMHLISHVQELRSGELVVLELGEHLLWRVDLTKQTQELVGKTGKGVGEFAAPFALHRIQDSIVVHDYSAERYVVLSADGKQSPAFNFAGLNRMDFRGGAPELVGADDRGRFYLQSSVALRTAQGLRAADSVAILRAQRNSKVVDTVAYVPLPRGGAVVQDLGGAFSTQTGLQNPFAPVVQWEVAHNGNVAIVYPVPYHVEWISPDGKRTKGPTINSKLYPVTDADKAEYNKRHDGAGGAGVSASGTKTATTSTADRDDWPTTKPPFVNRAVFVDGSSNVWVRRVGAPGETLQHYDVIDARGIVIRRVDLSQGSRVVGFGPNAVYVVKINEKEMDVLQRFVLP